jgi:hypothetical protein
MGGEAAPPAASRCPPLHQVGAMGWEGVRAVEAGPTDR